MNKKILKSSLILMASIVLSGVVAPSVAHADSTINYEKKQQETIENTNTDSNYVNINGNKMSKNDFEKKLTLARENFDSGMDISSLNTSEMSLEYRFAPAIAATYFVPGVGEVALTVTGGIIIAGVSIAAGSWLYNKCIEFFRSHRKNASKKNHDKHTKPRAGRSNEKKKQKKDWHKRR